MAKRRGLFSAGLALGAAAGLWAYGRWLTGRAETLEPEEVREPERTVYIGGLGLHFIDEGQGPPLLLIHGLGGSAANFQRVLPLLSQQFRVVVPDLLGFGLSDRPKDGDYSHTAQARRLCDLLDHLGIERAAVLGHSMGGAIALRLAVTYPQRVDKPIAVCSATPLRMVPAWAGARFLRPVLETAVALILHSGSVREWLLRQGFWDESFLTAEVKERYFLPDRLRGSAAAIARMIGDMGRDQSQDLSQVTQPTLLLWAEGDRWLPPAIGRYLESRLPDARLHVISQARHLVLEERPDESARAILAFLLEKEAEAPSPAAAEAGPEPEP